MSVAMVLASEHRRCLCFELLMISRCASLRRHQLEAAVPEIHPDGVHNLQRTSEQPEPAPGNANSKPRLHIHMRYTSTDAALLHLRLVASCRFV